MRWFPVPDGTDWYNWLLAFRETLPSDDIWAKLDSFNVTSIQGWNTNSLIGRIWKSFRYTNGGHATNKTVETYKWIWREILEQWKVDPETFWVIMTGAALQ